MSLVDVAGRIPAGVLVGLPVVAPVVGAALSVLVGSRARRLLPLVTLTVVVLGAVLTLVRVDATGPLVAQAGAWPAPYGITLVVDRLSALLVLTSAAMLWCVLLYAVGQGVPRDGSAARTFHPAYLLLAAGVGYAFVTGDLFNLFVAFEVMLAASYVLVTVRAGTADVRASMTYILASLLASVLLVSTVGLVYAVAGTVNLAQLHEVMPGVPAGVRVPLAVMLLLVLGIKSALFPLSFWLPDSYPATPAPVTAVFAGLLTKVGVYAVIRTQLLIFPTDHNTVGPVLLVLAGLTLVFGILGAIAQREMKRTLVFVIVSHIGFMVMGLGLFTLAGVAGAVYYVVHHIVMQTGIFCVEGLVERRAGTSALDRLSGLAHTSGGIAVLFALPALSLAGFPPFSGFIGKLALFRAAVTVGSWPILAVATVVSLLTVIALGRIWLRAFWGPVAAPVADADPDDAVEVGRADVPAPMMIATAVVVAIGVGIALAGGPLYGLCERAAADLLSPVAYGHAVLGGSR